MPSNLDILWGVRYGILGTSLLCSLVTIGTVLVGRLYRLLSCRLIFIMQICYAVININAIAFTDRFSVNNSPIIEESNPGTT